MSGKPSLRDHRSVAKRLECPTKPPISACHLLVAAVLVLAARATPSRTDGAQKHPILNLQQQHHSSYTKPAPLAGYHNGTSRPLERPSLKLVGRPEQQNLSSSPSFPEGPADWFMMGGAELAPDEARHRASFASGDEEAPGGARRSNMTRRMAEVKQRGKHATGRNSSTSSSGKTIFDDEQQSAESATADANEIYDDVDENSSGMGGTTKEPECAAHGRYYCTFKEDYPLKLVTEVTKYYKWPLEKLFRDLHAQIMPKLAQESSGNLVCDSITRVVRPGWARNTNERWLVVINTDNYHQYVTEVVCQYGTNSRCNFIPPCYYSSCQQRYNTQKLLVIDPTNPYRGPFLSEFLFPSCCVCYVPSASDSFQDKYRSSPATIYQRTMQQEAASNLNPPQFRPPGLSLLEEALSSSNFGSGQVLPVGGGQQQQQLPGATSNGGANSAGQQRQAGVVMAGASGPQQQGAKPAGPGEIRRGGDQYRRNFDSQQPEQERARQGRQLEAPGTSGDFSDMGSFPRLGLADSLIEQRAAPRE